MKLTNRDKQLIRQALYQQIDNILLSMQDKYSGNWAELKHLSIKQVAEYCYRIIGLYPKVKND